MIVFKSRKNCGAWVITCVIFYRRIHIDLVFGGVMDARGCLRCWGNHGIFPELALWRDVPVGFFTRTEFMKSVVGVAAMVVAAYLATAANASADVITLACVGSGFLGGEGRLVIDTNKKQMASVVAGTYSNTNGFSCTAKMDMDDSAYHMEEKCTKGDDWTLEIQSIDRVSGRYIFSRSTRDQAQRSYISQCKKIDVQPKF